MKNYGKISVGTNNKYAQEYGVERIAGIVEQTVKQIASLTLDIVLLSNVVELCGGNKEDLEQFVADGLAFHRTHDVAIKIKSAREFLEEGLQEQDRQLKTN